MAAAGVDETLDLACKTEAELRQWVEAHPGRVNDPDKYGRTLLYRAILE